MKKLAIVLLLVMAACRRQVVVQSPSDPNAAGAPAARDAVVRFLAAAKAQDIQALTIIWGSRRGPARETIPKDELEKRAIILLCYLKHDSYQILSDAQAAGGERAFAVQVKYRTLTKTSTFSAVPGPAGRWFVERFDPDPLAEICSRR